MRFIAPAAALVLATALAAPGLAQTTRQAAAPGRDGARAAPHAAGTPLDRGPFTPEANQAYQGGGMVLEGAPGAPPPRPEPTPPGQTPRTMVPAR